MINKAKGLLEFGRFRVDTGQRLLFTGDQLVPLSPKAFDTLQVLIEAEGRVVEKQELLNKVWRDTFVEEGSLANNISVLRKVLGESAEDQKFIQTIPKRGYRFVAELRASPSLESAVVIEEHTRVQAAFEIESEPSVGKNISANWAKLRKYALWAVISGILIAAILTTVWLRWGPTGEKSIQSLVVLPFANFSGDTDADYFSDGLTDELIHDLAAISGLRVVARTTAFSFKGKPQDIREIGKRLGVDAVLEGSVRKAEDRLRVTAQLNRASDGYQIWSRVWDRQLKDALAVQAEVASAIAGSVKGGAGFSPARHAANLAAYDAVLRGKFWMVRGTPGSGEKAIGYFQQALAADPNSAEAYAGLAEVQVNNARFYLNTPVDAFPKARTAAMNAISSDGSLADGHAQLAMVLMLYDWDFQGAERELRLAMRLDPSSSAAQHFYSHYLIAMGRMEESLQASRRAIETDPLSLGVLSHLAFHYNFVHDFQQAIRACEEPLEIAPGRADTLDYLQTAYEESGQIAKAIETRGRLANPPAYLPALREAFAREGPAGYWKLRLANSLHPQRPFIVSNYRVAMAYAHLGDDGHALEFLQKALEEHDPALINVNRDAAFDSLHQEAGFQAVVRQIGLP